MTIFDVTTKLYDRATGVPLKEVKVGSKPAFDPKTNSMFYADSDMVEITHGQIAMVALDTTLESDKKDMESDPSKWVRSVMKRESISARISTAIKESKTVEFSEEEIDIIVDRLAQITLKLSLTMTGPVITALKKQNK
jgi:hypothetical protein